MSKFWNAEYNNTIVKGGSSGHTSTNVFAKKSFIGRIMGSIEVTHG